MFEPPSAVRHEGCKLSEHAGVARLKGREFGLRPAGPGPRGVRGRLGAAPKELPGAAVVRRAPCTSRTARPLYLPHRPSPCTSRTAHRQLTRSMERAPASLESTPWKRRLRRTTLAAGRGQQKAGSEGRCVCVCGGGRWRGTGCRQKGRLWGRKEKSWADGARREGGTAIEGWAGIRGWPAQPPATACQRLWHCKRLAAGAPRPHPAHRCRR
jgi:hypothetical protein